MLFARYAPILFALAVAGSLAGKRVSPAGLGTMRTDNPTFVVLLIGVIVLVGALTFFPALLLGPIVQGLTGHLYSMKKDIITSALGIVVLTLLCGILYPLVITGVSQVAFPGNANGQRIYVDGKLVGSKIIGQQFADQVVYKNGKPVMTGRQPGHGSRTRATSRAGRRRPCRRTTPPRPRSPTRTEQHRHRAGDRGQHQGLPGAREAVRPGSDRGEGPGRRGQHLGVGRRSPTSRRPTPISRRTGSPPFGTCR